MAVTTGTTWDIVLANEPVGAATAEATVSPRAAYQAALYGRAALVDIRSALGRAREGELPAELGAAVVDRSELQRWLRESLAARVLVLSDDVGTTTSIGVTDARVALVDGGFTGWLAAGLPTA